MTDYPICPMCDGAKFCIGCGGDGCDFCEGTGNCPECHGSGNDEPDPDILRENRDERRRIEREIGHD